MFTTGVLLAALSGAAFAVLGVAYRLGQLRGVKPIQLITICGMLGTLVYGLRIDAPLAQIPARVYLLGAVVGASQCVTIILVNAVLLRGPLSPLWCVINLSFIPAVLYAAIEFGEPVGFWQGIGLATASLCVLCASRIENQAASQPGAGPAERGGRWIYLLLLLAVFGLNSLSGIAVKDLGLHLAPNGQNLMHLYGNCFYGMMYLVLTLTAAMRLMLDRPPRERWSTFVLCGLLAGCGSMLGVYCQGACAALPAAMAFAVAAAVSLFLASLADVLFFGERVSPPWLATVALGVLTVVFCNH